MKYRQFSDLNWNISEVGLGCWQIGWCWGDVDDSEARKLLKTALDQGINFFDTSDTYGDGRSERFLGELLKLTKEKIYISTKLGRRIRGTNYPKGYKHEPMEEFVDRSLKNLDIDCIELLQLHCPPSELLKTNETFETIDELVKKGKVAHYGVSVHKVEDALNAMKNPNVKSIQLVFNIFRQKPIEKLFKEAKKNNVAIIARGPLASGLLTGHINENTKFPENDHRNYNINGDAFDVGDTFSGINLNTGLKALNEINKILPSGFNLTQLALKWILMHDSVTTVIPGAVNQKQVWDNSNVSKLDDIKELIPKINSIYNKYIKKDVHHRW